MDDSDNKTIDLSILMDDKVHNGGKVHKLIELDIDKIFNPPKRKKNKSKHMTKSESKKKHRSKHSHSKSSSNKVKNDKHEKKASKKNKRVSKSAKKQTKDEKKLEYKRKWNAANKQKISQYNKAYGNARKDIKKAINHNYYVNVTKQKKKSS